MRRCENDHEAPADAKFCPECGAPLPAQRAAEGVGEPDRQHETEIKETLGPSVENTREEPQPQIGGGSPEPSPFRASAPPTSGGSEARFAWARGARRQASTRRGQLIAAVVLGVVGGTLIAVGGTGASHAVSAARAEPAKVESDHVLSPPSTVVSDEPETQKPTRYGQLLPPGTTSAEAGKAACSSYGRAVNAWASLADARLASSSGATRDAYAAFDYASSINWIDKQHRKSFEKEIFNISRRTLTKLTKRGGLSRSFIHQYQGDALFVCRLGRDYRRISARLGDLDSRRETLSALAASKPWYPRGWNEYFNDERLAWRWQANPACASDYFATACWGIDVMSEDGCGYIYVEVTILDRAGQAIDFSNDSLNGIEPYQVAKMTFESFEETAQRARLAEIDCY
jgi:hypothetical protein